MPTGLYGSPQRGLYREVRTRQSAIRPLASALTFSNPSGYVSFHGLGSERYFAFRLRSLDRSRPACDPQLTASASVDLDPLLPGQTSSWTVINRYNDALRWYGAKVIDGSGHELRVRDERMAAP